MVDVYEYLGRAARKSNEVDADIGKINDELILPGGFDERINVHVNGVRGFISKPDFDNSFILDNEYASTLDVSKAGLVAEKDLHFIHSDYDLYFETFEVGSFIDTVNTSATYELGSGIELGSGDS